MSKYFGNKAFYKMVLGVSIPIMIQNAITNFVGVLDNLMVGQLGTGMMSGPAIVNQLMFVFQLCIFGGLAGAGIFTAQHYGSGDMEGVRHSFRYKLYVGAMLSVAALLILGLGGGTLIGTYLRGTGDAGEMQEAMTYGRLYLNILLLQIVPFALSQVYASTLRECGETVAPMRAGVTSVLVNLVFNWLLIYGKLGFPQLGVAGAAIATVLARVVECCYLLLWVRRHPDRVPYMHGAYASMRVPAHRVKQYTLKGLPLLMNEALWSATIALINQCYSVRSLDVVAGMNISTTICNLFNVVFFAMGTSIAIVVGQQLGAGHMREAKETDTRMIVFSVCCGIGTAILAAIGAPLLPLLYKVNEASRVYARDFILITACIMPMHSFLHSTYFTIRTGGKTVLTFFFDCGFTVGVNLTLALFLSRCTTLDARAMFAIVEGSNLIKCVIGYQLVKRNIWLQKIVSGPVTEA